MVKIYTRTGDDGETGLYGAQRVRKDSLRIEAIGAVDELNAMLGLVRVEFQRSNFPTALLDSILGAAQHRLFDLGAELATPEPADRGTDWIDQEDVAELERGIDTLEAGLEPLRSFILPGGVAAAAQTHVARAVCRRAERRLVSLASMEPVGGDVLQYVNRLGDLLFVLAREANRASGVADVKWEQRPRRGAPPAS